MRKYAVAIIVGVFAVGCSTEKNIPDYKDSEYSQDLLRSVKLSKESFDNKSIEQKLTQAAVQASNALSSLAEVKKARSHDPLPIFPGQLAAEDFSQLVTLDWSGPVEPVMKMLVEVSGYRLKVYGAMPTIPPVVTVDSKDVAVSDVIKDVVYQAQDQVDVKVDASSKEVQLYYKGI